MYNNEDSFIRITCDNFNEFKDINIIAFSIADPGACGCGGRKVMVDAAGKVYFTHLFDDQALTEEQFLHFFPVFKDYHPLLDKNLRLYRSPGWIEKYMGLGNHLFIKENYLEKFNTADKSTSKGELYMSWLNTILSIL